MTPTLWLLFALAADVELGEGEGDETTVEETAAPSGGAINPFACLGGYEVSTGRHDVSQIRRELDVRLGAQNDADLSAAERARDACVIGKLKARLGDFDAPESFETAIELDPEEPGWELFAGEYWSHVRGARGPVLERAERHYDAALDKLAALEAAGALKPHHETVRDWVRKRLLVLHQQDGLPIVPFRRATRDDGAGGWPGLFFSTQAQVARDARDFFYNSEMRQFTGEAAFASSDLRAKTLSPRQIWDLARAPLRYQIDNRLRLRQPWIGAIDLLHSVYQAPDSQVAEFYKPTAGFSDVWVQKIGLGFERVLGIGSLFDVRLAGSIQQVDRQGAVEFLPGERERFWLYEAKPSISRFFGPNKLTIDGVYALLELPDMVTAKGDRLRQKVIRAARATFAIYAPLVLPTYSNGALGMHRTPLRGVQLYAGAMQDDEVYGSRMVTRRDFYGGVRYGGAGRFDLTLQGTYYTSNTSLVGEVNGAPTLFSVWGQFFSSARGTAVLELRLVDPERLPGTSPGILGFSSDTLTLVVPIHSEHAIDGRPDYENVRAGVELWTRVFASGLGGTSFLLSFGYHAQYFHRIEKTLHSGIAAIRMGWGDL